MEHVTTDNCTFGTTTWGSGNFIAHAVFTHRCPDCGGEETKYGEGYPLSMLSHSAKHIEVRCSHCNVAYFSQITCILDLCQVYADHSYIFADNLAHIWGLTIGALKHYQADKGATQ